MDAVLTMTPPPRASSSGMARFIARKTPVRPSSMVWVHTVSSISAVNARRLRPAGSAGWPKALLWRLSSRPKVWTVPPIIASMPAGVPASATMVVAVPPAFTISAVTARALAPSMSATATLAPRSPKPSAVARPMPDPAPETSATLPSNRMGSAALLPDQWTAALAERAERLLAGDRAHDLGEVPLALRFIRRLHLHEVHVADHPAVLADAAVLRHEVVVRQLRHLRHDRLGLVGAGRLDRFQVMHGGAVGPGLDHGGRHALGGGEAVAEGARLRRHVPVERAGHQQPLRGPQADGAHLRILDQERGHPLPAPFETELVGLLDGIGDVGAPIRHHHHLGLRALRLEQVGREVRIVQRVPD